MVPLILGNHHIQLIEILFRDVLMAILHKGRSGSFSEGLGFRVAFFLLLDCSVPLLQVTGWHSPMRQAAFHHNGIALPDNPPPLEQQNPPSQVSRVVFESKVETMAR